MPITVYIIFGVWIVWGIISHSILLIDFIKELKKFCKNP